MALILRSTTSITIAEIPTVNFAVQNICLVLPDAKRNPIDLGSLVYSIRSPRKSRQSLKSNGICAVEISSLRSERIELIESILDWTYTTPNSELTVYSKISNYTLILDWLDSNGCSEFFSSETAARSGYLDYTNYLSHQLLVTQKFVSSRCLQLQIAIKNLITFKFGQSLSDWICAGVRSFSQTSYSHGEIPEEKVIRENIRILQDLSREISKALMRSFQMPYHLTIAGETVCILPYHESTISSTLKPCTFLAINTVTPEIRSAECLVETFGLEQWDARKRIAAAQEKFNKENSSLLTYAKGQLINIAIKAYANLFIYITGAAASELIQFEAQEASNNIEDTLRKQLKAIKMRAKGKVTKYTIGRKSGITFLKDYLEFRKWVCETAGLECSYLFFQLDTTKNLISQLNKNFHGKLYRKINHIYPNLKDLKISPRISRKIKNIVLHELQHTPHTIAKTLNHDLETNLRSYSHQTLTKEKAELKNYWSSVRKAAELIKANSQIKTSSIASGRCNEFNNPQPHDPNVPIEPKCESQLGCLYCTHYSCHPDEEDVHKLLSLQYVLTYLRENKGAIEQTDRLFKDLSIRIDEIVDAIGRRSDGNVTMVEALRFKVFQLGILTSFWELRLQRLEELVG